MISLRNSGDTIAGEFSRLVSDLQALKKQAGDYTMDGQESGAAGGEIFPGDDAFDHHDSAADETMDAAADETIDAAADETRDAADFLVDQVDFGADQAAEAIDGAIGSMDSIASSSGMYIMNGLGKIAAGLRVKGEGFAADMVEATALSIGDDLNKEANEKSGIIAGLRALATEFDAEKDTFAGDMVRATISNIINE